MLSSDSKNYLCWDKVSKYSCLKDSLMVE